MTKVCFVLLADTDTHEAMGRMANALTSAPRNSSTQAMTSP
jgi:hypothetical protein